MEGNTHTRAHTHSHTHTRRAPLKQQNNGVDCGLFAITFVQFFMHYEKYLIKITFKQSLMQNHAMEVLEKNKLELFPVIKGTPIEPVKLCKKSHFTWKYTVIVGLFGLLAIYDKQIYGK